MELIAKYSLYAEQCCALAAQMRNREFKRTLEQMAREWERLASQQHVRLLEQINHRTGADP
jgi:hypothetical protein